jgi:hypothetical protein
VFAATVAQCIYPEILTGETAVRGINVNNLNIEGGVEGLYVLGVAHSTFKKIFIRACSGNGLLDDACVGNFFEDIFINACGYGLNVCGSSSGAVNTTQWFKNIYISYSTNVGLTLAGSTYGAMDMTFDNVVLEYNGTGFVLDGGVTSTNTTGNSFKNIHCEGNTANNAISGGSYIFENVYDPLKLFVVTYVDNLVLKDMDTHVYLQVGVITRVRLLGYIKQLTEIGGAGTQSYGNIQAAIPDTTAETLANVEIELNKVKQALRNFGIIA